MPLGRFVGASQIPDHLRCGEHMGGRIESDGTFKLATMTGGQTSQGALSGAHRVTIIPPPEDAQQQSALPPITLPDPVRITPGENNHFELRLPATP